MASDRRRVTPPASRLGLQVWDSSAPLDSAISDEIWTALRTAVEQVQREWSRVIEHAGSPEEATWNLAELSAVIREAVSGAEPDLTHVPHTQLSRRLLALVRAAFIDHLSRAGRQADSKQLLRVLGTLENIGQALEPNWAQHLADRLSGPDGLELVVEVAHDIRSPLTSVLFLAETLQRGRSGPVNDVQERQLGLIYSAAFGLSAMASDVIELARGGDRLVDLDPIPFSVADILQSVRDIVQPIAEEKSLDVRVESPLQDFRVGHPVALSRVLLNLTTNALKFTNEGYVELTACEHEGTVVEFAVRDTGRGIPPQNMTMLFEPFRRRQREGEYAFSGSGLGLSICRKLVEAMGSTLEVSTEQGAGTRFYFTLELPTAGHGLFG